MSLTVNYFPIIKTSKISLKLVNFRIDNLLLSFLNIFMLIYFSHKSLFEFTLPTDYVHARRYELPNKKSTAGYMIPPFELLVKGFPKKCTHVKQYRLLPLLLVVHQSLRVIRYCWRHHTLWKNQLVLTSKLSFLWLALADQEALLNNRTQLWTLRASEMTSMETINFGFDFKQVLQKEKQVWHYNLNKKPWLGSLFVPGVNLLLLFF